MKYVEIMNKDDEEINENINRIFLCKGLYICLFLKKIILINKGKIKT